MSDNTVWRVAIWVLLVVNFHSWHDDGLTLILCGLWIAELVCDFIKTHNEKMSKANQSAVTICENGRQIYP